MFLEFPCHFAIIREKRGGLALGLLGIGKFDMKPILLGALAAVGLVGVVGGGPLLDRSINYAQTDATVTAVTVDCYIKGPTGELVDKTTQERLYMNCASASETAQAWKFEASAVRKRQHVKFSYKSAADGSSQVGELAVEDRTYPTFSK